MAFIWRISPDDCAILDRTAAGCHCLAAADQNDGAAFVWH